MASDPYLLFWKAYGFNPVTEYPFAKELGRKFRFDYCWPDIKIAVEKEGGIYARGKMGHSSVSGILRDMEKMNIAGLLGWRVFRFTPQEIERGIAQDFMHKVFRQQATI